MNDLKNTEWNTLCSNNFLEYLLFSHQVRSHSFATQWTIAHKDPLSMGFSRLEYWSGSHFLLQGIILTQGSNPRLQHSQAYSLPLSHLGSPFQNIPYNNGYREGFLNILNETFHMCTSVNGSARLSTQNLQRNSQNQFREPTSLEVYMVKKVGNQFFSCSYALNPTTSSSPQTLMKF